MNKEQLEKNYKEIMERFIDYVIDRKGYCIDADLKTRADVQKHVERLEVEWDHESIAWESWYLAGYHDCVDQLQD